MIDVVISALVVILAIGVGVAFLHWLYEHALRFFSISSWRRCPECDRFVLREAATCKYCGFEIRPSAHDAYLRRQRPAG